MKQLITIVAIAVAGVIHLVLAPSHYAHAPAHGIFFILAGIAEIVWAVVFWRRSSEKLYYGGVVLTGGLIVLWILTRFMTPPFEHEPGPVDASGLITKLCELAGLVSLVVLAVQGQIAGLARERIPQLVGIAIGLALISGIGAYQVGLAAEPLFPGLRGAAENGHEESGTEMSDDHGEPSGGNAESAHGTTVVSGDLHIEGAWARPSIPDSPGAVYLVITNEGNKADRLTGVQTEIATAEIHESRLDGDVMKMVPLPEGIEIPANGKLEIRPGGYHIMLVGLERELKPGDEFEIILTFENNAPATIEVTVNDQ
jgi:copper(I)-binding protein